MYTYINTHIYVYIYPYIYMYIYIYGSVGCKHWGSGFSQVCAVQGYLAHKKTPSPIGTPYDLLGIVLL